MLIRSKPNWVLPESAATDETYFLNRRELCKRFQVGLCTSPSCRFAHWCAMRECQDLDRHPAKDCPNA